MEKKTTTDKKNKKDIPNKEKKKENSNMKKYIIFSIIIVLVISLMGFLAYKILVDPVDDEKNYKSNEIEIAGYGIFLDDSDTELYREEFYKLKENLESKDINYDEYAKSVARMFIIDLYTIKNKINKYDVGGTDFIYPDFKQNYIDNVDDTLYKYVEDNSKDNRTQNLPMVKSIEILETKEDKFKIESEEVEYDSYIFNLSWDYSIDLGYDNTGEVIVINKDNKLYVVEKN